MRAADREPFDGREEVLLRELCRHAAERFPGRVDAPTLRSICGKVLIKWRNRPSRDAAGAVVPGLKADIIGAVLAWLRENGKIPPGSREYDELFTETVFNGRFDAAEIRRGMRTLVRRGQVLDFLIVTYYLDMAEIDGSPPHPADVVERLRGPRRNIDRGFVRETVLEFYQLLCRQAA
ncbi:hypothetical protein AB0368_10530 [Actinoplanes sp. NPDC051475]|uniref:hypothetical protein n=1 Tax=Actinoplanes sp. NPDC051475 TaxID=3157225 RepID=UPI00344BC80E